MCRISTFILGHRASLSVNGLLDDPIPQIVAAVTAYVEKATIRLDKISW
jgi:hypothetical protein